MPSAHSGITFSLTGGEPIPPKSRRRREMPRYASAQFGWSHPGAQRLLASIVGAFLVVAASVLPVAADGRAATRTSAPPLRSAR